MFFEFLNSSRKIVLAEYRYLPIIESSITYKDQIISGYLLHPREKRRSLLNPKGILTGITRASEGKEIHPDLILQTDTPLPPNMTAGHCKAKQNRSYKFNRTTLSGDHAYTLCRIKDNHLRKIKARRKTLTRVRRNYGINFLIVHPALTLPLMMGENELLLKYVKTKRRSK